jgi:hypothetical protein
MRLCRYLPLLLSNLRINVIGTAAFGRIAGGVNKNALFIAAGANLGRHSGLQGVTTLGALPPILLLCHHTSSSATLTLIQVFAYLFTSSA